MTKFENESLLRLLSMKAEELENLSKVDEDIDISANDKIMFKISKSALHDLSERIIDLRSEIFFVNNKLEWMDYFIVIGGINIMENNCKLCGTKYDFRMVQITKCLGTMGISLSGSVDQVHKENAFKFCPECGRKLTKENFDGKEI